MDYRLPTLDYRLPTLDYRLSTPAKPEATADLAALWLHRSPQPMDSATILVADDDTTSARFLQRLLTREGHHVRIVESAEAALSACEADPPDLILIDLVARGHAFDVCRRLKEHQSTRLIPVVIVTALSESGERLKGIEAGADDFVLKPYDPTELRARVQSLVRLKRYTDDLESAEAVFLGDRKSVV